MVVLGWATLVDLFLIAAIPECKVWNKTTNHFITIVERQAIRSES
jgi:hypothetical protein